MSFYGDVNEIIVDGVSGISVNASPAAIFVGTCSIGTIGKKYIIGKSSDLASLLGKGNLVDRIRDFFLKAPKNSVIIAIPSAKDVAGSIGTITLTGTGQATYVGSGTPACDADILIKIITGGALNVATCQYSIDGGDNWSEEETIPATGIVTIGDTGVIVTFTSAATPSESFVTGDIYSFSIISATSSLTEVMNALNIGLETYTPRFCYIAQVCDNTDKAALGARADELFEDHKPTYFICEAKISSSEDIDDYVDRLVTEKASYSHRFVVCCASFGEIIQTDGYVPSRNHGGLLAGTIASARVNQSIGEVATFPITVAKLSDTWTEAHSKTLCDAGYCVLRKYSGLSSYFWARGRTIADASSDYQFIETIDTVFKAVRLARAAALKNLQSGIEDNLALKKIKEDIADALSIMTKAKPKELSEKTEVILPENQDIVNNGLAFELNLKGIPILGSISLYFLYSYADPFES
ncbi:MAG: hypothetical protein JXB50_02225 [Spirochaetes bacterium]|nr:hypothetical protein [Spirochaetota bacterium]